MGGVWCLGVASSHRRSLKQKALTWAGREHPQETPRSCWRQFWPRRWRWWRAGACRGPGSGGLRASWDTEWRNVSGQMKAEPIQELVSCKICFYPHKKNQRFNIYCVYNILCNYFKFKYLKGCVSAACFFRPLQPPLLLLQLEALCCESVCVPFFLCGLQTSTFGARCLWQANEADTQTAMSMCWMSLQYKNNKTAVTQLLMGLWGQSKQCDWY